MMRLYEWPGDRVLAGDEEARPGVRTGVNARVLFLTYFDDGHDESLTWYHRLFDQKEVSGAVGVSFLGKTLTPSPENLGRTSGGGGSRCQTKTHAPPRLHERWSLVGEGERGGDEVLASESSPGGTPPFSPRQSPTGTWGKNVCRKNVRLAPKLTRGEEEVAPSESAVGSLRAKEKRALTREPTTCALLGARGRQRAPAA